MSVTLLLRKTINFVAWVKHCMICQSRREWLKLWWDKDSESMSKLIISILHLAWALWRQFYFQSLLFLCSIGKNFIDFTELLSQMKHSGSEAQCRHPLPKFAFLIKMTCTRSVKFCNLCCWSLVRTVIHF